MLLGLEPRTKKAAELMHDLGISAKDGAADSFYQLNGNLKPLPEIIGILNDKFGGLNDKQKEAALAATFTKYGLAGLNTVVMEGKDKFEELKNTLMDEKAADIAREKMNNLQGDMLRAKAAMETMAKSFGDTLAPALRGIVQHFQSLVQWFTNLSPATKETIMVIGGLSAAIAVVGGALVSFVSWLGFAHMGLVALMEIGAVSTAVSGLGTAFSGAMTLMMGPWGLLIAAVVAGVVLLITHWDQVKAATESVWNGYIKPILAEFWSWIGPTIKNAITDIKQFWDDVWPKLAQFLGDVFNGMMLTLTGWYTTVKTLAVAFFTDFTPFFQDAWNVIKDFVKLTFDTIANVIKLGWDVITGIIKTALDLLNGDWDKAFQDMVTTVSNVWTDVKNLFSDFLRDCSNFGNDMIKAIADGIKGGVSWISDALSYVWSQAKSFFGSLGGGGGNSHDVNNESPSPGGGVDGSHANGLWRVPKDGYRAILHSDEMVLTADQADRVRNGMYPLGSNFSSVSNSSANSVVINVNVTSSGSNGKQIGLDIASALRQQMKFSL